MLKPLIRPRLKLQLRQPPSGGCVLKHFNHVIISLKELPAAFRRLCVETRKCANGWVSAKPAAFRRLCVETALQTVCRVIYCPAAFRRLCVETSIAELKASS